MKNKLFFAIAAAFVALLLCACQSTVDADVGELAKAALDAGDLPKTVEVNDTEDISDTIGLDFADIETYSVYRNMMSVDLAEIVVVKAKNGAADRVRERLNERKAVFSEQAQFYPQQAEAAEQTLVGQSGDYLWLLCCRDSENAENAITELLRK